MKHAVKKIAISVVGVLIVGAVVFSPWDAFYRYDTSGPFPQSQYVGNFPVWIGSLFGLDGQRDTVVRRIDFHNQQITEYEKIKQEEPQVNHGEIDRMINAHKKERRGLLQFLFGYDNDD